VIIKGARAALPGLDEPRETDIRVEGGTIAEVGPALAAESGEEIVDARGLLALPGGIDPHVHFDDPGYTEREDFFHGTSAAASGGITTVIDMPCTSVPPVTDAEGFTRKLAVIEREAVVDFGLFGGVSAQSFERGFPRAAEELAGLVLGFKTYFVSGMESFGRLDHYRFRAVLEKARELGLPVLLHAEDYDYVQAATAVESGKGNGPMHYYRSRPETAEVLAALAAVRLAEETGADLHVVHVASAEAAEILGRAAASRREATGALDRGGARGADSVRVPAGARGRVSAETAPHYLAFGLADFERMGAVLKCAPPVKGPGNRERLWELLSGGFLDFVASDHAPCKREEKHTGSIWTDYGGIPGCGTLLPYMVSEGYLAGRLTLRRLVEVTSENAACRYGLFRRKGSLAVGKDGDFALVDPEGSWTVKGGEFFSKGRETPFEGARFRGKVVMTVVRGRIVYTAEKGITAEAGSGRLQRRGDSRLGRGP
jgi:dihydroorotase-like cyclic amidohydrolase